MTEHGQVFRITQVLHLDEELLRAWEALPLEERQAAAERLAQRIRAQLDAELFGPRAAPLLDWRPDLTWEPRPLFAYYSLGIMRPDRFPVFPGTLPLAPGPDPDEEPAG